MAVSALLLLLVLSPLMRGGNRQVALIALEAAALFFLVAAFAFRGVRLARPSARGLLLGFVVLSPAWLALVYLLPLPQAVWSAAPGRSLYAGLLASTGIAQPDWLPLSLVPDATLVSLLAGLPLIAAFVAGYRSSLPQLRLILQVLVLLAFVEVLFGLLQVAGGRESALNFGAAPGRPFGTFANPNHFANYIGMGLVAYVWLAWARLSQAPEPRRLSADRSGSSARVLALLVAGAVVLIVGILASRSRGAMLAGLPMAMAALFVALTANARQRAWRFNALFVAVALAAAIALVGLDIVFSRFDPDLLANDAPSRTIQAATTLEGAAQYWPFGAGWGTYYWVYPRFQPAGLVGTADYAHQDYAQMLFEGGIFAALLMAAFGWLAISRAVVLVQAVRRRRRLRREEMAPAICGLGLLGFLLHSFVEFNMHIPANAIAAALLAGVYLRPLDRQERDEGRAAEAGDD